jgi:hypothetical protein
MLYGATSHNEAVGKVFFDLVVRHKDRSRFAAKAARPFVYEPHPRTPGNTVSLTIDNAEISHIPPNRWCSRRKGGVLIFLRDEDFINDDGDKP